MADNNPTEAVSRRNVLKTAGGLIAGSTMLAGLGAGRGAALPDRHGPIRIEIEELTEEYIAVRVRMSEELYERVNERGALADRVFLGPADRFRREGDTVQLPEDPDEGLATPARVTDFEKAGDKVYTNDMLFRTSDLELSEVEDEEVTMGLLILGPSDGWATDTVAIHVKYQG